MKKFHLRLALCTLLSAMAMHASAQTTRVEQTHPSITYTGNWQTIAHPYVSGGTIAASKEPGARASIAFNGTGIAWIGYACPCAGIARMYLDGVLLNFERDTYAASQQPQALMRQFSGLADGPHVLTIEATGQRNGSANDSYIGVDAFDIGPQDPVPPTVTLTSPADGAVVTGLVTFSAEASDNTGVSKVAFYADNHFLGEDRIAPYSIQVDTSAAPQGETYLVKAIAYDAVNTGEDSATVTVYQNGNTDVTPPFIEMTAPANQALVTGTVTISADGYDNVGITRVEFYASRNGTQTLIGTDTAAPWSLTRDTSSIPSGTSYVLTARAYDAAGLSYTSTNGRVVTVQHEDSTRPTVNMTLPAAGTTLSGTVRVAAAATDDQGVSGVAFFLGQQRWISTDFGDAPWEVLLDTTQYLDGVHGLYAEAVDNYNNRASSPVLSVTIDNRIQPGLTRIDDADPGPVYTGTWTTFPSNTTTFHWGSVHDSGTPGDKVSLTFDGVGVRLLSSRCMACGSPLVSIDGGAPQQINLGGTGSSEAMYESPLLAPGTHTIEVTVQGNSQYGSHVFIDGFEVLKVADADFPTVTLTSPAFGDVLSGSAMIEASASDAVGVSKVQFYVGERLVGEDTTAPYSVVIDTRDHDDWGYLDLAAVAVDAVGHRTRSTGTLRVNAWNESGPPPSVTITSPAQGATVSGDVSVSATVSWPGGVSWLNLGVRDRSSLVAPDATDLDAPYSWTLRTVAGGFTLPDGTNELYVTAQLADRRVWVSPLRTIVVDN